MTLNEFITKYSGQKVRGGQCGELVRQYWIDVDNTTPPSYTNSKDYWFNPVPGYDKVSNPQPGDIAIYNGHGSFPEGHSAIYYDGRVFEQNADPDGSPAHLFNRANTYLLGYLRNQGGIMSADQVYAELYKRDVRMDQLQADISHLLEVCDALNVNMDKLIKPGGRLDTDYANLYNAIQAITPKK